VQNGLDKIAQGVQQFSGAWKPHRQKAGGDVAVRQQRTGADVTKDPQSATAASSS
jgi:hypothetical protein